MVMAQLLVYPSKVRRKCYTDRTIGYIVVKIVPGVLLPHTKAEKNKHENFDARYIIPNHVDNHISVFESSHKG